MPKIIMKGKFSKSLTHTTNYLDYIANQGDLFSFDGDVTLFDAMEQTVKYSTSQAWFQSMSLQHRDFERLALDKDYFQSFITAKRDEIAKAYNISPANLVLYASLHPKDYHPHLHMVFFSKNKREGFVPGTKKDKHSGLKRASKKIKSIFANTIFQGDLHDLKVTKAGTRDLLNEQIYRELVSAVQKEFISPVLQDEFNQLSRDLRKHYKENPTGRKVYMYLPPHLKEQVNAMLKTVVQSSDVTKHLFEKYADCQRSMLDTYADSDKVKGRKMAAWEQAFYSPGKGDDTKRHNMIVRMALGLDAAGSRDTGVYRPKSSGHAAQSLVWNVANSLRKDYAREAARNEQQAEKRKGFDKTKRKGKGDDRSPISHDDYLER